MDRRKIEIANWSYTAVTELAASAEGVGREDRAAGAGGPGIRVEGRDDVELALVDVRRALVKVIAHGSEGRGIGARFRG